MGQRRTRLLDDRARALNRSEDGERRTARRPRPVFINEYGWLWINRDGSTTALTDRVYEKLLGKNSTPEQRIEIDAYLLAGLTEYWRAHRNFAGVLHFVYLTCSYPGVFTSDHFRDVEKLELHQPFVDYVAEAFKPVGVYVNFWQPKVEPGQKLRLAVMLVNDQDREVAGELRVGWQQGGARLQAGSQPFTLPPLGSHTVLLNTSAPELTGSWQLSATALYGGEQTVSRRKLEVR